jgi:transposase, IS5 family
LIADATCCPADIRYPNDMSLLNEARENTERMIDFLYPMDEESKEKPRDYREVAHTAFITYTKKRRPSTSVRRKALRKQLNYLKRNIKHIERMLSRIEAEVPYRLINRFIVVKELYRQQRQMYERQERKVEKRIVSVTQPHIRPIVRGKAGISVEFGAKISLSLSDGFSFIDHLSWENFNEAGDLIYQIEKYKERYGYYPESVHADKIYQNRENRKYCKDRNIRMTGKPLGRPPKETEKNKEELKAASKQRYQDDVDRIAVEGRFGVAKRKYGMGLIKAKLKSTSETEIFLSVLVMNLDKMCAKEMAEIEERFKIKRGKVA